MLENKNAVHQEVEDLTVGSIKRPRTLSSASSSSSELGSLQVCILTIIFKFFCNHVEMCIYTQKKLWEKNPDKLHFYV